MFLFSWLGFLRRAQLRTHTERQPAHRRTVQRRSLRPALEHLEERCLLSYSITDLSPPGYDGFATGINNANPVQVTEPPFIWQNGATTLSQLIVNERQELRGGLRVALFNGRQNARDLAHQA